MGNFTHVDPLNVALSVKSGVMTVNVPALDLTLRSFH